MPRFALLRVRRMSKEDVEVFLLASWPDIETLSHTQAGQATDEWATAL